jgi:hypothetical protein
MRLTASESLDIHHQLSHFSPPRGRIALAPPFPGLRRFKQGRNFSQWTGDDSKALMKVCTRYCSGYHHHHSCIDSRFIRMRSRRLSLPRLFRPSPPSSSFAMLHAKTLSQRIHSNSLTLRSTGSMKHVKSFREQFGRTALQHFHFPDNIQWSIITITSKTLVPLTAFVPRSRNPSTSPQSSVHGADQTNTQLFLRCSNAISDSTNLPPRELISQLAVCLLTRASSKPSMK